MAPAPFLSVDVTHQAGSLFIRAVFAIHERRAALFGPSGTGKSTLLRILAGLVRPDEGQVLLGEHVLWDARSRISIAAGEVGFVTQSPALFPHLSVEKNLRFGMHGLAADEQRQRAEELLQWLDLQSLRTRLPASLSGGERQRVALARALARKPRLLLLDEPFSALDNARKTQVWAALEAYLEERKIATLLVSHDAAEVWERAKTVVRMDRGMAIEQGPPAAMLVVERELLLRQLNGSGVAP